MNEQLFATNKEVLQKFVTKSESSMSPHYVETQLRRIVESMKNNPEEWDKRCSYNIKKNGDQFIDRLKDYDFKTDITEKLLNIFASAYCFLYEYYFFLESEETIQENDLYQIYVSYYDAELHNKVKLRIINKASSDLQGDFGFIEPEEKKVQSHLHDFDQDLTAAEVKIKYAIHFMPPELIRHYLRRKFLLHKGFDVFSEFDNKSLEAKNYIDNWDKNLEIKKSAVDVLQDKLEKQIAGFNFALLHEGFRQLLVVKEGEAKSYKWFLLLLGMLILLPLSFSLISTYEQWKFSENEINTNYLFWFVSLLSLEIILIYYFRIVLLNYRSVKTQILQIQLRQTLCQFIQNYVDYSKEAKTKDSTALDKFENLIFSNILAESDKLPSTFDGLETLTKLINDLTKTHH